MPGPLTRGQGAGAHQLGTWAPQGPHAARSDPAARSEVVDGVPFPRRPKQRRNHRGPGKVTDNPTLSNPKTRHARRTAALLEEGQETGLALLGEVGSSRVGSVTPSTPPPQARPGQEPRQHSGSRWAGVGLKEPLGLEGLGTSSNEELSLCSFLLDEFRKRGNRRFPFLFFTRAACHSSGSRPFQKQRMFPPAQLCKPALPPAGLQA